MNIPAVSEINFEGRKNPNLHLRRKQMKRLKAKEAELTERCKLLEADCAALELPLKKVTTLPYDSPKAPIASRLWKRKFDLQYNLLNGSYSEYKESKKLFAKDAVENLDVLPFVKNPIQVNGSISAFSNVGRNVLKNTVLDMFRFKTPEENQLMEYYKGVARTKAMHETLGIK